MNNSYEVYGLHRKKWREIKEDVMKNDLTSNQVSEKFDLHGKQLWFLFDNLLQGKYDDLYKRGSLTEEDIKLGQYVYSAYPLFGRGEIVDIFKKETLLSQALMLVQFEGRKFPTMCDYEKMLTVHDDVKRKITKL